jgi:hypothetical protein
VLSGMYPADWAGGFEESVGNLAEWGLASAGGNHPVQCPAVIAPYGLIFVAIYFIYFSRHQSETAGSYVPLSTASRAN